MSSWIPIQTISLTSNQASFSFTSIPTSYIHLLIKISARANDGAAFYTDFDLSINGQNSSFWRAFYGINAGTGQNTGSGQPILGQSNSGTATTNAHSNGEMFIFNYQKTTTKYALGRHCIGNNSATVNLISGLQQQPGSSVAINSVTLTPKSSLVFVANSTATLYGIKNSA